ncbi:SCP2 sterol-binding domain-containing protein [Thermomonospora umbrina]|uniref:SCP-2 sterol transfer family protein n=1 Tax=Thermomonospora umbrina TaxID=111806 RepID=A0A3D9SN36_9ACTN|nr:SCP2 sterol-binding domain-containing protein [Thermomonospora umbrina]REE97352.1 SCP-2 sterol transfer family protein [Thermomonospora umbrina]
MSDHLKDLLGQVSTPRDLRRLLEIPGMDETIVDQFVVAVGPDVMLGQVFDLMATRFKPRGRRRCGIVQWDITTSTGRHRHQLVLTPIDAHAHSGSVGRPDVTLTMSAHTLLHLCSGRLNPVAAYRARILRIRGNLLFGVRMGRWFDY